MLKVLLATLVLSSSVFAVEEAPKKADPVFQEAGYNFVGFTLGAAKPVGSNISEISGRLLYGVEYAHALANNLSVGAFVDRHDGKASEVVDVDFAIVRVGAQASFNPTYDSIVSLKAGMGFLSYSTKIAGGGVTITPDSNPFFVAPSAGIIFPVMDKMQLIPSLGYAFFFETSDVEAFQVIDGSLTLRYQF